MLILIRTYTHASVHPKAEQSRSGAEHRHEEEPVTGQLALRARLQRAAEQAEQAASLELLPSEFGRRLPHRERLDRGRAHCLAALDRQGPPVPWLEERRVCTPWRARPAGLGGSLQLGDRSSEGTDAVLKVLTLFSSHFA